MKTINCSYNNPYNEKWVFVESVLRKAIFFQGLNESVLAKAEEIEVDMGIKGVDSLHLACAEEFGVDFFITSNEKIIKRYQGSIILKSPTSFVNSVVDSLEVDKYG